MKKMMIGLIFLALIAINVLLWTLFAKESNTANFTAEPIENEKQELEKGNLEGDSINSQKHNEIWVDREHGIFVVHTYNAEGKEVEIAYNDNLETVTDQFGKPNKKEPDMETLNYVYDDLSIGIQEETSLVTLIHFIANRSILDSEWYKKLGEPDTGTKDDIHFFYNEDEDQILKFEVYEDDVNVILFKNDAQNEGVMDESIDILQPPNLEPLAKEYKTLKEPIYGGDVVKIGPFGPYSTPGQTSFVVAEIEPFSGKSGFAPYEENGQLPQQVFKPLDKIVQATDLSFWLEPVENSSLTIMNGESSQFYLCIRVAPKPRYTDYYFSVNLKFFPQGSGHTFPLKKIENIEVKMAD